MIQMGAGTTNRAAITAGAALALFASVAPAAPATINNLTGLPTYPNLDRATMDGAWRTETFGRWCATFTGVTGDSLTAVEEWYRKKLARASETDLTHDERFKAYPTITGIKLALGVNYVTLYRLVDQSTIIELHRCSGNQ